MAKQNLNKFLKTAFEMKNHKKVDELLKRGATPLLLNPTESNWEFYQEIVAKFRTRLIHRIQSLIGVVVVPYLVGILSLLQYVNTIDIGRLLVLNVGIMLFFIVMLLTTSRLPGMSTLLCLIMAGAVCFSNMLQTGRASGYIAVVLTIPAFMAACRLESFKPKQKPANSVSPDSPMIQDCDPNQ